MIKTPVININNIKFDKINNNYEFDEQQNQNIYKPLKYKYSDNIDTDFKIFINWTKIKILSDINLQTLSFKFLDDNIVKIINDMTNYLNLEHSGCNAKFNEHFSQITLIPSKKSNLEPYTIKKEEGISQINKYFPFQHKNPTINIVGKFILKVFVFKNSQQNQYISFKIINAEIKYEQTFVKDDQIKLESIYNNHVLIRL